MNRLIPNFSSKVRGFSSVSSETLKTAVYDNHVALKGKMVPFAGYYLPLQYSEGVKTECIHTRTKASLFDVSHMGQVRITGSDSVKFIESIVVGDIESLKPGNSQLSLITNEEGGIIDDTVITKEDTDVVGMVINGACKHKDLAHMKDFLSKNNLNANIEHFENLSLFALQGPEAATALTHLTGNDLSSMLFMTQKKMKVAGLDCTVTRCGYTGEDGFEISVENKHAPELMDALINTKDVKPAGLGARDTLRVEAGLCLYGIDIDETTSPIDAGLLWTIGKRRRTEGGFVGADKILDRWKNKANKKKRVGLVVNGPPARAHTVLYGQAEGGEPIGEITSGTFSPQLAKPIAMGYVDKKFAKSGTEIYAQVRNKRVSVTTSKMPFIPAQYYRGPQ